MCFQLKADEKNQFQQKNEPKENRKSVISGYLEPLLALKFQEKNAAIQTYWGMCMRYLSAIPQTTLSNFEP